ncbi:pentatricopeptide repeat-containing protein At3g15590, mitochondrial [Selaginella moellendorffii]|nr:pentatricopeptide repeat-containing protein At3g15590, mitochondrial [Selaginella moellendorffii]|eukprot:XP_002981216.2 pentatricopeptide repeat-containing protein At3g15590, mitochondrial [Selaginella moellendorffii]
MRAWMIVSRNALQGKDLLGYSVAPGRRIAQVLDFARSLSFSRDLRGRPKQDIVRNRKSDEHDRYWGTEENDLRYDASRVTPSDDEDNVDPNSLVARLEDDKGGPVLHILHQWIAEGRESHGEIIAAMKRLKWLGRFKQAYEISDWVIKERSLELQKFHFINHLDLTGRVVNMNAAKNFLLTKMPRVYAKSEAALITMFENYVIHSLLSKARLVLKLMKEKNLLTTATAFNKLFHLYANKKKEDGIPVILREMRDMRISPNVETYNILIGIKAKKGDTEGMERLFSKMKCDGDGTPNCEILCTLASGYVNAGDHEKAMAYLKEAVASEEFQESRRVHDKVIALYAAMGRADMIDRIWRFTRRFPVVSANSYVATIAAYEKVGRIDRAEKVFAELTEKRTLLRPAHYVPLFRAYCEGGEMGKAEKLLERIRHGNGHINNLSYHHLVAGYMKSGNPKMAAETLNRMFEERVPPCFDTVMLILKEHAKNADVSSAELLFQDMRRESYNKNVAAYNSLLEAYVNAGKHAYRFLQRMATDKVAPNARTFELLNKMRPIPKLCADNQLIPSNRPA